MNSSKGLVAFAVLHHVLVAFAILLLGADTKVYSVILSVGAFGLLSIIVRRGWQVAADSAMSPGKAQGFLFIPFLGMLRLNASGQLTRHMPRRYAMSDQIALGNCRGSFAVCREDKRSFAMR